MQNRKEELSAIINKVRADLDEIEVREVERNSREPVGKCFKCQSENAYRWLYLMITEANGDYLSGIKFEKDINGKIEITSDCDMSSILSDNCKQISRDEFTAEWRKLIAELDELEA